MTIMSLHLSSSVHVYVLWRHLCSMTPWIYVPSFNRKKQSGPLVRVAHFLTFDSNAGGQREGAGRLNKPWLGATWTWFHTSCNQRLLTSHKFVLKNYCNLAMLILFILYGKVSISASGLADKIHSFSFQQTHEQSGISRIEDTLRIKYNFGGQAVEDPRTVSWNAWILSLYIQ